MNEPERIYLQVGDEYNAETARFKDCEEVTWCTDSQFGTDIEYCKISWSELADLHNGQLEAIELTGGSAENIAEAIEQWKNERLALAEFADENQALTISFRQFDIAMTIAEQLIASIEKDAGMFITQAARDKIEQFRTQVKLLENRRAFCRQINADATARRNKENPHNV